MPNHSDNRGAASGGGRRKPPANPYARPSGGGVPPLDAFDGVNRRPPPDLPPPRGAKGGSTRPPARPGHSGRTAAGQKSAAPAGKGGKNANKAQAGGKAGKGKKKAAPKPKKPRRPVNPARQRRNRRIAALVALVALIGGGVWFSFNVLFKIDGFVFEGESRYSEAELRAAFGLAEGDNMFAFRAGDTAQRLTHSLPYIETLRIHRRLPGTVVFTIEEAQERYCLPAEGGYAVLSESLKVLRIADAAPEGATRLYGLSGLSLTPGYTLGIDEAAAAAELALAEQQAAQAALEAGQQPDPSDQPEPPGAGEPADGGGDDPDSGDPANGEGGAPDSGDPANGEGGAPDPADPPDTADEPLSDEGEGGEGEPDGEEPQPEPEPEPEPDPEPDTSAAWLTPAAERLELLQTLIIALQAQGLADITWINVADPLNLQFRWQDRITVKLGPRSGMDEKLKAAAVMLTDSSQNTIGDGERGILDVSTYPQTLEIWFGSE